VAVGEEERIEIAKRRIVSNLRTYTVANLRTLEQKIADAGPPGQHIDPHLRLSKRTLEENLSGWRLHEDDVWTRISVFLRRAVTSSLSELTWPSLLVRCRKGAGASSVRPAPANHSQPLNQDQHPGGNLLGSRGQSWADDGSKPSIASG
jgi:hypothetical protein